MKLRARFKRIEENLLRCTRKDATSIVFAELQAIGCDMGLHGDGLVTVLERTKEPPAFTARRDAKLRELQLRGLGHVIAVCVTRIPGEFGLHLGNVEAMARSPELAKRVLPPPPPPPGTKRSQATGRKAKAPTGTRQGRS